MGSRVLVNVLKIEHWHRSPGGLGLAAPTHQMPPRQEPREYEWRNPSMQYVQPALTFDPLDPWATIPMHLQSIVRSYINSEQSDDKDRALRLCEKYALNYHEMRRVIMTEMVAEWDAITKRRDARANRSAQ